MTTRWSGLALVIAAGCGRALSAPPAPPEITTTRAIAPDDAEGSTGGPALTIEMPTVYVIGGAGDSDAPPELVLPPIVVKGSVAPKPHRPPPPPATTPTGTRTPRSTVTAVAWR